MLINLFRRQLSISVLIQYQKQQVCHAFPECCSYSSFKHQSLQAIQRDIRHFPSANDVKEIRQLQICVDSECDLPPSADCIVCDFHVVPRGYVLHPVILENNVRSPTQGACRDEQEATDNE